MASPSHLFRVVNEFVFMLVGALLVLFALTGRYLFNPRRPGWIGLSLVLILWGFGTWRRARLNPAHRASLQRMRQPRRPNRDLLHSLRSRNQPLRPQHPIRTLNRKEKGPA